MPARGGPESVPVRARARVMKRISRFLKDRSGNIAVIFALSLVPVMGLAGVSVDTARLINVRTSLQAEADATALNAAVGGPNQNFAAQINAMNDRVTAAFGRSGLSDLNINGGWNGLDFRVDASARVSTMLVHTLPGISDSVRVSVRSTARLHQPMLQYEPPEVSWLDPEAGDYNRIYVYCFDPDPDSGKTSPSAAPSARRCRTITASTISRAGRTSISGHAARKARPSASSCTICVSRGPIRSASTTTRQPITLVPAHADDRLPPSLPSPLLHRHRARERAGSP